MDWPVRPIVAELVGPPGSGKTMVLRSLPRDGIVAMSRLRRQGHLDLYLRNTLALVSMFPEIVSAPTRRWKRWDHVVRLRASLALVERCARMSAPAIVFDQGPTFTLMWLRVASSAETSTRLDTWLERMAARWADALDLVIFLDAPDDVLLERIRSRSKSHVLKDREEHVARGEIARIREAFDAVIARLGELGGLRVLRYDTSRVSVDAVVRSTALSLRASERSEVRSAVPGRRVSGA
jgi:hypothetical protein